MSGEIQPSGESAGINCGLPGVVRRNAAGGYLRGGTSLDLSFFGFFTSFLWALFPLAMGIVGLVAEG